MVDTLPGGFRHQTFADVNSTNTLCLEAAQNGDPGDLWITAGRQLQGRGSRGRQWISEPGNLYASLLLRAPGPDEKLHTLTFVTSLAIRDAIYALPDAGFVDVALKWPNDVLLNGKKTSGILLESHHVRDARFVIIGMGVNISHFPQDTLFPATSLQAEGINTNADDLVQFLSDAMAKRLAQWDRGNGFELIRADFLSAVANLGKVIEVKLPGALPGQTHIGKFAGMDNQGRLLLEGSNGKTERISVADIFFA